MHVTAPLRLSQLLYLYIMKEVNVRIKMVSLHPRMEATGDLD